MNKDNLKMNKVKEINQLANEVGDVMEVIRLINDLINFMPSEKEGKVQTNPLFYYGRTQEALENVFSSNQGLLIKLDNVASALYEISDEFKESEEERITVDGIVLEDGKIVKDKNEQVEKWLNEW